MGRFFNMDSPFMQFLTRLADLMILNLVFLITCIPIVTIGAAWTSLYYVTLKMIRDEDAYIVRSYFKSFKQNFKQATVMWLILLVLAVVLFLDFGILRNAEGTGNNVIRIGLYSIIVILLMTVTYVFPVLSKFYNTVRRTFINAFLMSVRHLPQTVIMLAIPAAAVVLTLWSNTTFAYGMLLWIMLGFAAMALAKSWFLVRIFDNYIPGAKQEETEEGGGDAAKETSLDENREGPELSPNENREEENPSVSESHDNV